MHIVTIVLFQSVMTADGDKFVEKHTDESMNGMEMNITRYIEGDKMVVVSSLRIYRQMVAVYFRKIMLASCYCFSDVAVDWLYSYYGFIE